jgi:hypothetical protein
MDIKKINEEIEKLIVIGTVWIECLRHKNSNSGPHKSKIEYRSNIGIYINCPICDRRYMLHGTGALVSPRELYGYFFSDRPLYIYKIEFSKEYMDIIVECHKDYIPKENWKVC